MTGHLQTILIEKYGPILEQGIDGAIEWGPDFIDRVIKWEIIDMSLLLLFVVILSGSLIRFSLSLFKKREEYSDVSFAWTVLVFGLLILLIGGFTIVSILVKLYYVPELYLYQKYI